MRTSYKGRRFLKNPFDVVIYLQLLDQLRPATIIEIGTSAGGSAVWLRDQCRALDLDTHIYTFDITPPENFDEPGISSGYADSLSLAESLDTSKMKSWPKPWLIIEDSAHFYETTLRTLEFFDPLLSQGDYIVVEDGVVADLPGSKFEDYEDGPNRAVHDFLIRFGERYEIDVDLCDYYGPNVTYCPNGWLKVIA